MKTIDDIFAMCDSRYALVNAIAKRARQMSDDAVAKKISLPDKPVNIIIRYLMEEKAHVEQVDENDVKIIIDEPDPDLV